ncbi:hypothetical protein DJ69_11595 [Halorubrum persicum]|uniref:Tetrapyrrole biosynthesis glutamyl-tRNA reductase dimerisation domain-containing protein n=1 Tax=Halorubrum persicum TaxID=1383844 RepID=A0A2G1WHH3_9EURY|nr:hypothetical protein DJ69_11595 [Halorubrum persicum]
MTSEQSNTERHLNGCDDTTDPEADPDCIRRRLLHQAARIERREVEEALSKLEARDNLTDEQRRTIRVLGDTLAWRLMANFELSLKQRSQDSKEGARAVARLFNLVPESHSNDGKS